MYIRVAFYFFSSFRYLLYPFSFSACDITLSINNYCSIRLFDEQILALKNFATAKGCEKIIIDGKINAIVQKLKRNDDKNYIILAFVHVCLCECLMTTSGVCMSCICVQFYSDCIKSLQQQILLKKVSPLQFNTFALSFSQFSICFFFSFPFPFPNNFLP